MQNNKLIEAIKIAKDIMDYCGGDAWERECTEKARNRFREIYDELFPEPPVPLSKYNRRCDICNIVVPKGNYESHINGIKHKKKIAQQDTKEVIRWVDDRGVLVNANWWLNELRSKLSAV